ncbi:MAG: DUF3352 domain-containing protein [Armatimonadetes bacterium]|nr:DUF3352 domain-containing protein [Armatimonadota bacterium]
MKMVRLALLPCSLALLLACAGVGAQQGDPADGSVPAGSVAYVSIDVNHIQQFWDQVKNTAAVKALTPPAKPGSRPNSGFAQMLGMFNQAFQGRVAIAFSDDPPTPKQPPAMVAVFPARSREDAAALLRVVEMGLKQENAQVTPREYHGATITALSGGKLKDARVCYALLSDRLLLGTDEGWLEKAIDTTAGGFPALAAAPEFEAVRARLAAMGPAAGWYWVDTQRLNGMMMTQIEAAVQNPPESGPAAKMPPIPKFDFRVLRSMMTAYKSSGGRLVLSPQGITVDGISLVNAENEFGRKILAQTGARPRSAELTSANALLYLSYTNVPFAIEMVRTILGALEGDAQKMLGGLGQSIQMMTGLDPEADLLRHIGGEWALVLNDVPTGPASFPLMLYVQTTNRAGLGKSLQRLRASLAEGMQLKFEEKNIPQGRIYSALPGKSPVPVTPGWTFAGDFLVVGAMASTLKSPLFLAAGGQNSLAAAPAYRQALDGGERVLAVAFVNLSKLAPLAGQIHSRRPQKPGAAGPDPRRVQAALTALRSFSMVSTLQPDALAYRVNLSLDLAE